MKNHVFILILIVTSITNVASQECVVFNLEDDFEETFLMGVGNCEGHPAWILDHYGDDTDLIATPPSASTAFIYPEETLSCTSTVDFEMESGGEVEVNVYMESGNSNAFINILVYQKNEGSDDTFVGNSIMMDNQDGGWRLLQYTVPNTETFTGYISMMGFSSEQTRVKVDYIRYTSPDIEKESCVIYNEGTELTTTVEPTSIFTTEETTTAEPTSGSTTVEPTTSEVNPTTDVSTTSEPTSSETTVNLTTDESTTVEPTSIFTTEETTNAEPTSGSTTFEPTTSEVNPTTDESTTVEPTSIFTTEETTTDESTTIEPSTFEPTSIPTTIAPTSEPTTAVPIISNDSFWNPFTISMTVISCLVVLCVLGFVFYDIGKRKAAKQLPTIIIDDFEYLPKPSMVPRVKSVYGNSSIDSFGRNNRYP